MVPTTLQYQWGLLEVPYMSSMSHNNGVKTRCERKFNFKFEESSRYENIGGMGGLKGIFTK